MLCLNMIRVINATTENVKISDFSAYYFSSGRSYQVESEHGRYAVDLRGASGDRTTNYQINHPGKG